MEHEAKVLKLARALPDASVAEIASMLSISKRQVRMVLDADFRAAQREIERHRQSDLRAAEKRRAEAIRAKERALAEKAASDPVGKAFFRKNGVKVYRVLKRTYNGKWGDSRNNPVTLPYLSILGAKV